MNPRRAGALLPGAYAVLVLAPAVLALLTDPFTTARPRPVEASAALGLFAVPLVMLQFALISRIRSVSRWLGTDLLVQFHQYAGLLALALALLHVLLLNSVALPWRAWSPFAGPRATQAGAIAFWALAAIAASTVLRQRLGVSYESWRTLHLALAVLASAGLAAHLLGIGGYTRGTWMRGLFVLLFAGAAALTVEYRIVRPLRLNTTPWRVVSNRDEGASVRTLRLRPDGHEGFTFAPGQFAWLITGRSPFSPQQHPLSISSSPDSGSGSLEFSIKAIGDWSGVTVPALEAGARVWVDGPYGAFTPVPGSLRPLVLVAGGIGIAPMRSILLTLRDRRDERHVVLIHAAHDESRVAFAAELDALRSSLHLTIVYVFEEPGPDWTGARGFITEALLRQVLGAEAKEADCFVCGPVPMMNAVEKGLVAAGVRPQSIHTERFQVI